MVEILVPSRNMLQNYVMPKTDDIIVYQNFGGGLFIMQGRPEKSNPRGVNCEMNFP